MKIAITGSSGLVGTAVSRRLDADGHQVTRMVRTRKGAEASGALFWDPSSGEIDSGGLAGQDAVLNLAGENIFGLWTEAKKRRIRESRVAGTSLIAEAIAGLDDTVRPKVLVNWSAIGYYGDRPGGEAVTEEADPGDRFMSRVAQDWEAATAPAAAVGTRVAILRSGLVLDPSGLLLQAMAVTTWLGLGAKLGDGQQVFPWVTRDELANLVAFVLGRNDLSGPINAVAPDKVTNAEFADTVARVMGRPRWLKIPEAVLRMGGELGDELLTGAWVVPRKLTGAGYRWRDPLLEPALRRLL